MLFFAYWPIFAGWGKQDEVQIGKVTVCHCPLLTTIRKGFSIPSNCISSCCFLSFPRDHLGHLGHLDSQAIQEKRSGTPLPSFRPAFNKHCGFIIKQIDVSLHSFHIRYVFFYPRESLVYLVQQELMVKRYSLNRQCNQTDCVLFVHIIG